MTPNELSLAIQAATIATALVAGIFLAFSDFIMRALTATPEPAAARTMQEINVKVMTTLFMLLFIGLVPALGLLATLVLSTPDAAAAAGWVTASAALYILGCFGVTVVCNVPMNNRLARLESGEAAAYWPVYRRRWTFWNTVRTLASTAASVSLLQAAITLG